jgi:uncharacterized protein (TIGR00255 family)
MSSAEKKSVQAAASAPLASMTGYAGVQGAAAGLRWTIEARSVNGRGLDLKSRIPGGWEVLDGVIKQAARDRLVRGNVGITVQIELEQAAGNLRLNEALLQQLTAIAQQAEAITGRSINLDNALSIRGVLETPESAELTPELVEAATPVLSADIEKLLDGLVAARRNEGAALLAILEGHAATMRSLIEQAAAEAADIPAQLRKRLETAIAELTAGQETPIPEERLAQEILILATKADVREELDRLRAHLDTLHELLGEGSGVGRRLDFLAQEFNREANTLCSKSSSTTLTRIGMEMKTVIDQLREQVQNVE